MNKIKQLIFDRFYIKSLIFDRYDIKKEPQYKIRIIKESPKMIAMNIIDFRYWFCDCSYTRPYGLVISADCKKHD